MKEERLAFCTMRLLAPDLVETCVDEGVEFSPEQVAEMHLAHSALSGGRPFGLLVAKIHSSGNADRPPAGTAW